MEADWQTQTKVLQGCYNVPPWHSNSNSSKSNSKRFDHRPKRQGGKTVLHIKSVPRVPNPQKSNNSEALRQFNGQDFTVGDDSFASSTVCMVGGANSAKDDSR